MTVRRPGRGAGPSRRPAVRGVTLAETLVCAVAALLLLAAALPLLAAGRSRGLETVSLNNLRTLLGAHTAYAGDFNGAQYTTVPDVWGALGGGTAAYAPYVAQYGCLPALQVGYGCDPRQVFCGDNGFWLPCDGPGGNIWGVWPLLPFPFGLPAWGMGGWQLHNAKAFNSYVSGRFYDPVFYAPADGTAMHFVGPGLASPNPFTAWLEDDGLVESSYCRSVAALVSPSVFGGAPDGAFVSPDGLADGYHTPSLAQVATPELKTWFMEHRWLQSPPARLPAPNTGLDPYFNGGAGSVPMTLFYDGRVGALPIRKVLADNDTAVAGGGAAASLWLSKVQKGNVGTLTPNGYFENLSVDGTKTSTHLFTRNGVLGRDVLAP